MLPPRRNSRARAALIVLAGASAMACGNSSAPPPAQAAPTCDSTKTVSPMDAFVASDVAVAFDGSDAGGLGIVRGDVARYLGKMWGASVDVSTAMPTFAKPVTVWFSSGAAAKALAGADLQEGYLLKRVAHQGKTVVVVYAPDAQDLAYGAYAFLEELGARFFHPMDELVPTFGQARLPKVLDVQRAPAMRSRGIQVHTLHPLDTFEVFNEPSAKNLADAKRFVDWLVKTGQNYFQWVELSTVTWDTWKPYAEQIIAYAHSRGVTVGANIQMWGGASLQNNFVLVSDASMWQPEMDAGLDKILSLPWDTLEIALGEFVSTNPQSVIDWLDHAVSYALGKHPSLEINVQNHVGNYPQLWVKYDGKTVFYYHLPAYADPRLGQSVHTLFFFDLYRDWATYAHPNFHLQHDYILKEIPTRRVKYFPESAYWISADIDVPLFLPEYIYARWLDLHKLTAELAEKGLPKLDGHLMFNSGHEWNYWMTDYLTAKMTWEPEQSFDYFVSRYADAFGSCASHVHDDLGTLTSLETEYLFDKRLVAYVQGEDETVDLGYMIGLETHPKRVAYEDVLAMSEEDRTNFEKTVVDPLAEFASKIDPLTNDLAKICAGADAATSSWCNELYDGTRITELRAQHGADLYKAVLDKAKGQPWKADYDAALAITTTAKTVIARREAHYRFPLFRDTGDYANPTVYAFGYLRPAHTACYYERNEQQAETLLTTGKAADVFGLPSCQN